MSAVKIGQIITEIIHNMAIGPKTTFIYDIDDTLIDSRGHLIQPIADTYLLARSKGIKTVIITARTAFPDNIAATNNQLASLGLAYDGIFLRDENMMDVPLYKLMARRHVAELGHEIMLSVGDKWWDIGNYGGIGFLIQN